MIIRNCENISCRKSASEERCNKYSVLNESANGSRKENYFEKIASDRKEKFTTTRPCGCGDG